MKTRFIRVTAVSRDESEEETTMYLNADVMPMAMVDYGEDGTFINYDHTNGVLVRETVKEIMALYDLAISSKKDLLN